MPLLTQLPRPRPYVCRRCILNQRAVPIAKRSIAKWAAEQPNAEEQWEEQAMRIRTGAQPSILRVLEDRGFVKDIAGCVFSTTMLQIDEGSYQLQSARIS